MTKYKQKDSFIIHHDTASIVERLTKEQAGELFKHLLQFSIALNNPIETKKPTGLNGLIELIAYPFEKQLERDFIKYQLACEKNANNGKKGGRPPKFDKIKTQKNPKKTDNENEKDNEKENEKDTKEKDASAFSLSQSNCKENLDSSTSAKIAHTQKQCFSKEFQEWYECYTEPQKTVDWNKPSISKEKLQKKFNQAVEDIGLDELMEKTKYYLLFKKYETSGTAKMGAEVFLNGKYGEDYKTKYEVVCKKQGKPLPIQQKTPEKRQEEVKIKEDTQNKLEAIKSRLSAKEKEFNDYIKKEVLKSYFSPFHFESWIKNMVIKCEEGVATVDVFKDISLQWGKLQDILNREMLSKDFKFEKIEWKLID